MPAHNARDELLDDLRGRMRRVEEMLEGIVRTLSRVEAAEEQQKKIANDWFAVTWPAHLGAHKEIDTRLRSLETTRSEAKGAAWMGKVVWAVLIGVGSAIGFAARHYLGGGR